MDTILRSKYLVNDAPLRRIQKVPRVGLGERFALGHYGRKGVLSGLHRLDVCALGGQSLRRSEPLRGAVFLLANTAELSALPPRGELVAHFRKSRFAHAASECGGHNHAFVRYGFPFKEMVSRERHRLLCAHRCLRLDAMLVYSLASFGYHPVRLVAEVGSHAFMRL